MAGEPIRVPGNGGRQRVLVVADEARGLFHIRTPGGEVHTVSARPSTQPGKLLDVRLVDRTADREG